MVRVSVKNFGPIAEGSVDLKPLTIFIGPSNTGKSFMATAVYAVMKAIEGSEFRRYLESTGAFPWMTDRRRMPIGVILASEAIPGVVQSIWEWVGRQGEGTLDLLGRTLSNLPREIQSGIEQATLTALENRRISVILQLLRAYGTPTNFVRRGGELEDFRLIVHRDAPLLNIEIRDVQQTEARDPAPEFDISGATIPSFHSDLWASRSGVNEEALSPLYAQFMLNLQNSVEERLLEGFPVQTLYLPAARSGIAQGQKVLAAAFISQSPRIGIDQMYIPTLPGVARDFLGNLISLDSRTAVVPIDDELANAISFIEGQVLHGSADLDHSSGLPYPDIAYEQVGAGKFTLDQTSSMVSELAPLVLFLKYLVRPGDLLILEEPESHLHPGAQRQMARGIVRLVNAGIKVLITTHSDLLVAQVNNLMRSKHASQRWLREKGFAPEECINKENVGAYLFRRNEEQGGSLVEELEIRPDVGIDDAMFGEVINEIYEETLLVERIRVP